MGDGKNGLQLAGFGGERIAYTKTRANWSEIEITVQKCELSHCCAMFIMAYCPVCSIHCGCRKFQPFIPPSNSILGPATSSISCAGRNSFVRNGPESSFCGLALQQKRVGEGFGGQNATLGRVFNVRAAKRVESDRSFLLSSTLVAKEEDEDKVVELCKSITQWAQQKQKDKTTGIQQFECYVDPFDKHTYHFMERYSGFQHMTKIRALPEHTKFMNDVRPLLSQPIGFAVYECRDSQIGHMMNPIGPKGEGGLDDATGQGGSGGGVSHKQQSKLMLNSNIVDTEKDRGEWSLQKAIKKMRAAKEKTGNHENSEKTE